MKVGFIGLGTMGAKIAMNALKGGHALTVSDVARQVATPLIDAGASWAGTPAALAKGAEVIMMSLPASGSGSTCCRYSDAWICAQLMPIMNRNRLRAAVS